MSTLIIVADWCCRGADAWNLWCCEKRGDKKIKVYSMNMEDEIQEIAIGDYQVVNESDWTNYIKGVLWAFEKKEMVLPFGMDLLLFGDLPSGRDFLPQHLWKC